MAAGQRETRRAVVEFGVQPGVKSVAGLASGREVCGHVIGIGGIPKVRQVTGQASSRKSQELSNSSAPVTLLALHHSVRAEERKSVGVLLDRFDRYTPAADGVALCAVCTHLTTVDVRMAVRAVMASVGKHGLKMALSAVHFFVQAAQRVSRQIMIEFRYRADRLPTRARVAILAGHIKRAVGAAAGLSLGTRRAGKGKRKSKEH
jgi:hypothetical protein